MKLSVEMVAAASQAPSTVRAYAADWRDFSAWCDAMNCSPLIASPEEVAAYLVERSSTLRWSTLERRLAAIVWYRRAGGGDLNIHDPTLNRTRQGLMRLSGTAPRQKAALTVEEVRDMVTALPDDLSGKRDRALILTGYAGAFRRSELVAVQKEHLSFSAQGLTIIIPRAKDDPYGRGEMVGIPHGSDPATCPVAAMKAWLMAAHIEEGAIFRGIESGGRIQAQPLTGRSVANILKRAILLAGRKAGRTEVDNKRRAAEVAGHSLRAGFITAAAAAGAHEWEIARQTRHKRLDTIRRYIRLGSVFRNNAVRRIGL